MDRGCCAAARASGAEREPGQMTKCLTPARINSSTIREAQAALRLGLSTNIFDPGKEVFYTRLGARRATRSATLQFGAAVRGASEGGAFAMSNLDQERICTQCARPFRLTDHGVVGARAVAQVLDAGAVSEADAPVIVRTCPACLGTERLDPADAHAELFRLEHATTRARARQISRDTKAYASGLAFLGLAFAGGSFGFGVVRGHSVLSWAGAAFGMLMALSGISLGLWAFLRAHSRRDSQL